MIINRTCADSEWSDISDLDSADDSDEDYEPMLDENVVDSSSDSDCNDIVEPDSEGDSGEDSEPDTEPADTETPDDVHPYIKLLKSYGKPLGHHQCIVWVTDPDKGFCVMSEGKNLYFYPLLPSYDRNYHKCK